MSFRGDLGGLLARAASHWPDEPAILTSSGATSWQMLERRAASHASKLASVGLAPDDRVGLLAGITPFAVETLLALAWAGLVAVPINSRLSAPERQAVARKAGLAALIHETALSPDGFDDSALMLIAETDLDAGDPQVPRCEARADSLAMIIFTGGTTGEPKGVMQTHGDLAVHGAAVGNWLDYRPQERVLQSQPLFHIAGLNQMHAVIRAGATLLFAPEPGMDGMLRAIAEMGARAIGLVPTSLAMLLDRAEEYDAGEHLHYVRNVVYGAAPISPNLLARARRSLPNARFSQFYGQTEAGPVTALVASDHDASSPERLRSCGRPRPGMDLRIVDASGALCDAGVAGEVQFRGRGLTRGYWQDPEQSLALYDGEWLRSGDVGFLDQDGYLTIVDRLKDMIVTGGENVFSAEVEAVLLAHPGVAQAAVFGVPDPKWGETVHAAIVAPDPACPPDIEDIEHHCRARLAGYKVPRGFHFRVDLPLSAVGKVLKGLLREEIGREPG